MAALTPEQLAAARAAAAAEAQSDAAFHERMRLQAEARRERDAKRGVDRDNLAQIQAEATARARTAIPPELKPKSAADALPPETRAAIGLPMNNPPVHRAQIKPIPGEIDTEGFLAKVRSLPPAEGLSNKCRMAVARAIVWGLGKAPTPERAVRGVAQISYQSLATAAECCRTQAWRAVKFFQAHGILDIFNVKAREGNEFWNDANAYSLRGFTKAIPAAIEAVKDAVTGAYDRVAEQVRRFARVWDMRPSMLKARPAPA